MANLKLSQLPELLVVSDPDYMYIVSGGVSKKVSVSSLKNWNLQGLTAGSGITITGNTISLSEPTVDPVAVYLASLA